MILATLYSLIGLGLVARSLHRLTVNALPFFAAMSAGDAALQQGTSELAAMIIALFAGAVTFGLFQRLSDERLHPAIRIAAHIIYVAPACAAAWFITIAVAHWTDVAGLAATFLPGAAAIMIGIAAWNGTEQAD